MPVAIFARLSRVIPLVLILAVLAGVVYFVAMLKYSEPRAKLLVIKLFLWITGILSGLFGVASLYAVLDGNVAVLELFATFLATALIGLVVVLILQSRFYKKHPNYRNHPEALDSGGMVDHYKDEARRTIIDLIMKKLQR